MKSLKDYIAELLIGEGRGLNPQYISEQLQVPIANVISCLETENCFKRANRRTYTLATKKGSEVFKLKEEKISKLGLNIKFKRLVNKYTKALLSSESGKSKKEVAPLAKNAAFFEYITKDYVNSIQKYIDLENLKNRSQKGIIEVVKKVSNKLTNTDFEKRLMLLHSQDVVNVRYGILYLLIKNELKQDFFVDNLLTPNERESIYSYCEDFLNPKRVEVTLQGSREWRLHYWEFNKKYIVNKEESKKRVSSIYDKLPSSCWQRDLENIAAC